MKGARLLSIDRAGLLCVTDKPSVSGDGFGRKVLEEWQLLHGRLPPLLLNYVLSNDAGGWFQRMTAWLLWLASHGSGPWQLYCQMLPSVCLVVSVCMRGVGGLGVLAPDGFCWHVYHLYVY